jgi:DHA2 family multidrug resistance protein
MTNDTHSEAAELARLRAGLTPRGRNLILAATSMCTVVPIMALTTVNVVLPQLQGMLSATPDQISWVITLYVVGAAVATPVGGWLVARYGWRSVMLITVIGFGISTALCATATSLVPLLVYRALQGAFGAPMMPVAQAILLATYPDEDRAWSQAVFGLVTVVGQAMAPVIGGYFAEAFDWRWAFLFLIPLSVAAVAMTLIWIPHGGKVIGARLDWPGFLALSIAIVGLQLPIDQGERLDWFESRQIIAYALVAVVGLYVFVLRTLSYHEPYINPILFRDRNFLIGLVLIFLFGMLNFVPMILLPTLLSNLKGYPESSIGWLLGMRGIGMFIGFYIGGKFAATRPKVILIFGFLVVGISGAETASFDLNVQFNEVAWVSFLQGMGIGTLWVPIVMVTFATLSPSLLAQGSAINHLIRHLGTSIFVALSVSVVVRTGAISYTELSAHITPYNKALQGAETWSIEAVADLARLSQEIDRQAQMIGYLNAFVLYTAVSGAALLISCLIKFRPTNEP